VAALQQADFDADELAEIDRHAEDGGVDLWAQSSSA
jgi:L-glyceraldehyde 3-phosphate reductase